MKAEHKQVLTSTIAFIFVSVMVALFGYSAGYSLGVGYFTYWASMIAGGVWR